MQFDDQTGPRIIILACPSSDWALVVGGFPTKKSEGLLNLVLPKGSLKPGRG